MQRQTQDKPQFGMRESFNLLYALAKAHTLCITPFIRTRFGSQAFGFSAFAAWVMMLLYMAFGQAPEMSGFILVWMGVVANQRFATIFAERRGEFVHSHYAGRPALALRVPFVKRETTAKLLVEPLMCIVAGMFLCPISVAVGGFVMLGFVSLILTTGVQREVLRARVRHLRDAQIEQQQLTDMFHGNDNDF